MDTDAFKKLLSEGKEDEARELLEQFLDNSISPREQGKAIIAMVSAHMEAQNTVNEEYIRVLKNAAAELSGLQREKTQTEDAINLIKARKQLE